MEINLLKQSYKNQLVRAGVDHHKAEQAIEDMTSEELQLIQEVWSDWVLVSPQIENDRSNWITTRIAQYKRQLISWHRSFTHCLNFKAGRFPAVLPRPYSSPTRYCGHYYVARENL